MRKSLVAMALASVPLFTGFDEQTLRLLPPGR